MLKRLFPAEQRVRAQYEEGTVMNTIVQFLRRPTEGPRSVLLIRVPVGLIFFTQGILKYIDPNMGVARFTRIGFPHP